MWKEELYGQRFGRLIACKYQGKNKWGIPLWFCECDCGGTKTTTAGSLKSGSTKSCGCIGREHPSHTKHGEAGTKLYMTWKSMRERCYTPNSKSYKHYGARGISLCDEWNDFTAFRDWALSNGYSQELTIDRIDNNGNYEPSNCRWATYSQQARNKSNTLYYEINGVIKPLIEWCEIYGVNYNRARQRVSQNSFPIPSEFL